MQDLVALGTGNSRLMKSNISPNTTLSELISMLNNGTFPYDIGPLNAAGISQQGTPLNKANLLSDVTAALLGGVNTPNEAFTSLAESVINLNAITLKLEVGTYTGNGEASRTISLGFNPTFVFVTTQSGSTGSANNIYGGLALPGHPVSLKYRDNFSSPWKYYNAVEVVTGGFSVYETEVSSYATVHCNLVDTVYYYLAIGNDTSS